ncbi:hypothetical protein M0804_012873 [Polistes exclamans]|nr:hypothetical protein M0804_012873 [Polistes exclamans]
METLPPFYSAADLHNDQRLSCLSKLFSAICIIFCRAKRAAVVVVVLVVVVAEVVKRVEWGRVGGYRRVAQTSPTTTTTITITITTMRL